MGVTTSPMAWQLDQMSWYSDNAAKGSLGVNVTNKPGYMFFALMVTVGATGYTLMYFDKATPPVNGDVPKFAQQINPFADAKADIGKGMYFATGLGFALSTTPSFLTLPAVSDLTSASIQFALQRSP